MAYHTAAPTKTEDHIELYGDVAFSFDGYDVRTDESHTTLHRNGHCIAHKQVRYGIDPIDIAEAKKWAEKIKEKDLAKVAGLREKADQVLIEAELIENIYK